MATTIRHAARILQQSQAAEAAVRRLFQAKLPRRLTGDEKKVAVTELAEIQVKKEELYHQIAGWEARYTLHGSSGHKNIQLLRHLFVQVEPKHGDPADSLIYLYQEKHRMEGTTRNQLACCEEEVN